MLSRIFALGGNPADVYCIDVAWSMGDISDDEIGNNRKSVLEQAFFVWPNREDNEQYILETLRSAKTALHEILDRASRGEPVRIWYSHNPDEICGFYWLLAQLKKLPAIGSIYAVKLPEWEYSTDNTLCTHIGWGEISPEEWGKYLPLQREVKPALLNACAMRWKQLQQENAPLRIYLNGKLQSASENIYDSFILREVDEQADEFSEANLIGNVLGKNQLGIGDAWIALRMEKFIKEGMFTIVTTPSADDLIYHRTLRKCPYVHLYRSLLRFYDMPENEVREMLYLLNTANLDCYEYYHPDRSVIQSGPVAFCGWLETKDCRPYRTEVQLYKSLLFLKRSIDRDLIVSAQREALQTLRCIISNLEYRFYKAYGMEIEDKRTVYGECTYRLVPREDEPSVCLMHDWIYLPTA